MTVQGSVGFTFDLLDVRSSDNEEASIKIARAFAAAFTDGVGLNQANAIWQDTATLPDATPVNLDVVPTLSSGTAGIVTFARLKAVGFWASTANTTNIAVVRHASTGAPVFTAAGAGVTLKPGGFFIFGDPSATGVAVGPGTDMFTLTNSAATAATYSVVLVGGLT